MRLHPAPRLSATARRWRVLHLALLPFALFVFRLLPPGSTPSWFPFATSCGAITGLPCIFCGTTRAVCHLLHGEFALALYYNWLSFPLVAGSCALYLLNALELSSDCNLLANLPKFRFTGRPLGAFAAGLILLWCLQVYLAVSQHKIELLNPRGPLYSLVVH